MCHMFCCFLLLLRARLFFTNLAKYNNIWIKASDKRLNVNVKYSNHRPVTIKTPFQPYLKTEKKRSANIKATNSSVVVQDDGKCYYTLCILLNSHNIIIQFILNLYLNIYGWISFYLCTRSQSDTSTSSKVALICSMAASCMAPLFPILFPVIRSFLKLLFFCKIQRTHWTWVVCWIISYDVYYNALQ